MRVSTQVSRPFAAIVPGACALLLTVLPHDTSAIEAWRAHVATGLQSVYDTPRPAAASTIANMARFDAQGRVEADVQYDCASSVPTATLAAAGLSVRGAAHLPPLCVVEGWIAPATLPLIATLPGVTRVKIPSYVRHSPRPSLKSTAASQTGSLIDGNARTIMHTDQFVAQAGGGGIGVTVGVQSQGVASLATIQARNELPNVNVLTTAAGSSATTADEGTALLEEIHAVAPNAGLAFCEPQTFVEYTSCLQQFAQAGATVMVDDILFLDQDPLSSNGLDTTALEQFLAQNPNVTLFTAGGNDNGSYWEGTYNPVTVGTLGIGAITCPGSSQVDNYANQFGADEILTITPSYAISIPVSFAWSDPPGQNSSKFDVYWINTTDPTQSGCVTASGASGTVVTQQVTLYPGPNKLYIATPDASAAGKFLKLWVGGDGLTALSISTAGSFVSPQSFAPGAITVGAINGSDGVGNNIESFSSRGPISVVFPSPAKLQAPILVAPDGIYVDAAGTYFSNELFPDGNFYGTSAAAPNAAAVAALIRGAFPNLTPAQVLSALEAGATQLGASTPDYTFGYGRVDAMGALATFAAPTITSLTDVAIDASSSTTSTAQPITVSGTGTLHFSVTSTNTTLIPASVGAAAGTPGVTVSPSGCGSTTLTCSLTVTAAQYQGGTATVTVSAVDGAGRAAPATMHVTVTNPQTAPPTPPPPPASSGSSGGHGGGGSLSLWEILAALCAILARINLRRRLIHCGTG